MLLLSYEYYNTKSNMLTGHSAFSLTKVGSQVYFMGEIVGPCNNFSSNLISIKVSGSDLLILLASNRWET